MQHTHTHSQLLSIILSLSASNWNNSIYRHSSRPPWLRALCMEPPHPTLFPNKRRREFTSQLSKRHQHKANFMPGKHQLKSHIWSQPFPSGFLFLFIGRCCLYFFCTYNFRKETSLAPTFQIRFYIGTNSFPECKTECKIYFVFMQSAKM